MAEEEIPEIWSMLVYSKVNTWFPGRLTEEGFKYFSVCSHIYEISEFHHGIEGKSIQEHQQVSSLITGISNQRPPQSRYNLDIRFMARTENK